MLSHFLAITNKLLKCSHLLVQERSGHCNIDWWNDEIFSEVTQTNDVSWHSLSTTGLYWRSESWMLLFSGMIDDVLAYVIPVAVNLFLEMIQAADMFSVRLPDWYPHTIVDKVQVWAVWGNRGQAQFSEIWTLLLHFIIVIRQHFAV